MWKKIWGWHDFSPFVVGLLFSFWILIRFLSLLMKCFHTAFLFTHYCHLLILLGFRRISLVFILNNWLGLQQIQCTVHYLHCVFKFDDYFFSFESELDLVLKCPLKSHWEYRLHFLKLSPVCLPRECTGHSKDPLPTMQEKTLHMDTTRWSTHRHQIDYILRSQGWRSSIQSAKTRPGADCGSDHEHLIAKFRLNLKKVGRTTRPYRYTLNQILYDYTVEVRNRFKD